MTTRRRFSDKFKATGALEALRGDRTVQEIAAKHGLHPTQVTTWKRQAITVLSLTRQCKLLKISRSSLYYRPVGFDEETLKLMNEIDRVFTKYPFFGSRQITAYLPRNGFRAGRHRARRLMTVMGLEVIYKAPNTSKKHSQHKVFPYLLRKLSITRANHVWCSDITYIPMRRGFHCLVAIMDWATCKVLSWRLSNTLDASFCIEALNEAIAKYGNPEIMNTDQGSQFTGAAWITTLGDAGYQNINGRAWQISRQ
ncbi:MAG: IS3 family transposase, partial [Rhizobiaceae bacterium]|nr:IS3 family transposase [Rhizobiaceae bacterium]